MKRRRRRRKGSWLENHVAKRYRRAGFKILKHVVGKAGERDIVAIRGRKKYVIEVKSGAQKIPSREVVKLVRKAREEHGIPVLRIGPNVSLTTPAKKLAKKYGVRIRRVTWK